MVLLPLHFVAQTPNDEVCGTEISGDPDPVGVYSYSDDPNILDGYDPVSFNIFYWGVAKDDGTWIGDELTLEKVQESVDLLNEAFSPYKICFNLVGMDIIKKDSLHSGASYGAITNYASQNGYVKANSYNIYVPNLFCCYSGITSYFSTTIGIRVGAVASPSFIHEMGHTFNLYHTFGNNNDRPNPVNSQLTVTYDAQGATSAYLMLVNQTTSNSDNYILDTEESSMGIDVSGLPTGLYSVILVCNGEIQSVKNLVKQ